MFVVTCPKCDKQLHLPDTTRGKHVRCAGCQAIVLASTEPTADAPLPPRKVAPPPLPVPLGPDDEPAEEQNPVVDAVPGLWCSNCEAAAVMELPPDANSRKPGYVCAMCRTVMRPSGSRGNYYAAALLGAVIVLLGIGLAVVALEAKKARGQLVGGGAALAVLGVFVAGWAITQARLPVPIGANAPPTRFGFWIAVLVIALVLAGGGIFGLMYVMQEMM
jgi:LSD1 subclass zinc finger protein